MRLLLALILAICSAPQGGQRLLGGGVEKRFIDGCDAELFTICDAVLGSKALEDRSDVKVLCIGDKHRLDIYLLPIFEDQGQFYSGEGGPRLSFSVGDPSAVLDAPIVSDIFIRPTEEDSLHGLQCVGNVSGRMLVAKDPRIPLFVPVTKEDFLRSLIDAESNSKKSKPDSLLRESEIDKIYREMLRFDKEAAEAFRAEAAEAMKTAAGIQAEESNANVLGKLKKELNSMPPAVRRQPAFYGGAWAMEKFGNASGLLYGDAESEGDALVRANPALKGRRNGHPKILVILLPEMHEADRTESYVPEGYKKVYDIMERLCGEAIKKAAVLTDLQP